ncbi:peptidoglycan DD-metalloendopeptidase family protein [Shewanella sp. NIFS-20-20]|uniref:peptidoglycan DD-metalloendopeptidase family protein n=1 Tax=Shewanella sp. NIFS-20-20 TaxID=2853806 RepID=UPI001C444266|nr:peptidoglycan DD-metalloendopeptidase family protein [Shewanella sp. NIFS-20-20]MBV7314261.1 peptidoglycan DD-metalloendopeptidase family protein [Shewanella sp. NIFS-20-20]
MAKLITLIKLLPKMHQILLSLLLLIILVIFMLPAEQSTASQQAHKSVSQTDQPQAFDTPLAFRAPTPPGASTPTALLTARDQAPAIADTPALATDTPELVTEFGPQLNSQQVTVKPGDTLAAIFQRAGYSARDVYDITQVKSAKPYLLKLMPGDTLILFSDEDGKLAGLDRQIDAISTLLIRKQFDGKFSAEVETKSVERRQRFAHATIKSNFWNAAVSAGLSPGQIMELANLFGWDIDFALDLRAGDSFTLIYDDEYADGEFLRSGDILAAEFVNQGDRYTAVRYTDGQYYSESGNSMRKAFLRSPVDFKYVSSNFNPKRLHPVTGRVKAHRGVDYVAAVGTPIKAAGSGRVIEAGYNQYNGNYVFIKHNDTYTTKYLHLKSKKVKRGQSVKQGQVIGTLGATGRVTGAHLHYEFIVNGVHRNPRTINLPKAESIARSQKQDFLVLSQQLMAKLGKYQSSLPAQTTALANEN